MSKTQEHKWSVCPDCGGYSSEGHTGTERCSAYKPAQGHAPGQIAEALRTFIKSGSADGREEMRAAMLKLVPVFAAAPDLLAACKAALGDEGCTLAPKVVGALCAAIAKASGASCHNLS